MLKKFFLTKNLLVILSLIMFFITTSCSEDPIAPQEEHLKAAGMIFYIDGIETARILKGVTSDTLYAPLNGVTDIYEIRLIDEDGDELPPSSESQELDWEIEHSTIVDVLLSEVQIFTFQFQLEGLNKGETNVEFFIMHDDHSDFRSGKMPIRVLD